MAKNEHGLTPQQDSFATGVASGLSQAEAYRRAYPKSVNWKDATVWKRASELMGNGAVLGRIDGLRAELAEKTLWSRQEAAEVLKGIIRHPDKASDVVAAVKELNAMHGFNAPQKHEIKHTGGVEVYVIEGVPGSD